MVRICLLLSMVLWMGCGFQVVSWTPSRFSTIHVAPVSSSTAHREMAVRLQDALIQGCLSFSGLKPVTSADADLILHSRILDYSEQILATDVDGRTKRLQFSVRAEFTLHDAQGKTLWRLANYPFSEQYEISTTASGFKDEAVYTQDKSFFVVADLVITSFTQALSKEPSDHEPEAQAH